MGYSAHPTAIYNIKTMETNIAENNIKLPRKEYEGKANEYKSENKS